MDISREPVADFGANPQPPEVTPEAGLDERVAGDRPVQLQPDDVRHRRHHLRHHQPHQLGHRQPVHHQADGARARGDRGPRPDQPAVRRPAGQRARRHRRLPAHRPRRGAADDVHRSRLHAAPPAWTSPRPTRRDGPGRQLHRRRPAQRQPRRLLHRRRRELVPGHRAGRRHQRRHGRGGGRRQPVRLGARRRRPARSSTRSASATRGPRRTGIPADADRRVRPGQPQQVLRLRGGPLLRQHQRRRHLHPAAATGLPTTGGSSRRCPAPRATSGWPGDDAGCSTRPTPAPPSPRCPASPRRSTSASARRRRAGPTRRSSWSARSTGSTGVYRSDDAGADLGADQRRPAPVRQHGRGAHRRPAGLRPGLPRHQRPRHPLRRPPPTGEPPTTPPPTTPPPTTPPPTTPPPTTPPPTTPPPRPPVWLLGHLPGDRLLVRRLPGRGDGPQRRQRPHHRLDA